MYSPTAHNLQIREDLKAYFRSISIGGLAEGTRLKFLCKGRRHLIDAARRDLNNHEGITFESVHGVGYKRLQTDELHEIGAKRRRLIRRAADRDSKRIINGMKFTNDIDRQTALKINRELGILGILKTMAEGNKHIEGDQS